MNINATLFAQMIVFAILIWVTMKFIWPPLMKAMDERAQRIGEGLAAADRSRTELEKAEEQVNALVRDARTKANEIIDQAHARANQIIDAAKNEAIAEAGKQKALAVAEIDVEANRAREELRRQVSSLAVAGASRLLKREIDPNAHKALLDELAAELG
ncbi:MAG TPA: F0F1 ATP synthase subunit B [Xanthomonadaceae bacterium]|nr:F0F1 ATP synthase subunit B [Xanthomonadaceae bacterium]